MHLFIACLVFERFLGAYTWDENSRNLDHSYNLGVARV